MGKGMDRNQIARDKLKAKYKKQPKKILIYGNACHMTTGNSKLIYNMAKAFQSNGHEVFTIGMDYNNHQIWYDGIPILPGFHCENCGNSNITSPLIAKKVAQFINTFPPEPDYFICVGDPYSFQQRGLGTLSFENLKTISTMYCTMDSEGKFCDDMLTNQANLPDYLTKCGLVVGTSYHSSEQIETWYRLEGIKTIHEPINNTIYKPVDIKTKLELRKKYRFEYPDGFIMYLSGRNGARKRHNMSLEACAKLLVETDDTYVYVNIPKEIKDDGTKYYTDLFNPVDYVRRVLKQKYSRDLVAEGRIIFIDRGALGSSNVSEEENAELYQLSDLYVSTTGGEGFGLCACESVLCGVPVVLPNNSTAYELMWAGKEEEMKHGGNTEEYIISKGGLLTTCPTTIHTEHNMTQHITTTDNTYKAIKRMYEDKELRESLIKVGRKHLIKLTNFDLFRDEWLKLIETDRVKEKNSDVKEEAKTKEFNQIEL